MIQTKQPISFGDRGEETGITLVDVFSYSTTKEGAIFLINDWVIDAEGNKTIYKAGNFFRSNEELNAIDAYLSANHTFEEMTKTEEQWEKIKLGLMLDTQTLLLSNGKTIYGQTPEDWEFST